MTDPYLHTVEPAIERETVLNEEIEAPNGNMIPCDIQYEYTYVNGRQLITEIEVKIMFTPAGYQESIIAIIESRHPGCEFNGFPACRMVKQKPEKV
jgi:hypothetical protein